MMRYLIFFDLRRQCLGGIGLMEHNLDGIYGDGTVM